MNGTHSGIKVALIFYCIYHPYFDQDVRKQCVIAVHVAANN